MDMQGGKVFFKQGATENPYGGFFLNVKGGSLQQRNTEMGDIIESH